MNSETNDLERALHRRVDHLTDTPFTLDDVKGRARRIQRRRAATAIAGTAAVVAVLAPVGLQLTGGTDTPAPPPATQSPSGGASPSASPSPQAAGPLPITYDDVAMMGGEPLVPYWSSRDGGIVDGNGNLLPVEERVDDAVRADNGQWIGITTDDEGNVWYTSYDTGGAVLTRYAATDRSIAVTPDGTSYAYLAEFRPDSADPPVWQVTLGGPRARSWDLEAAPEPGAGVRGILADGSVVFETGPGEVRVARQDGSIEPFPVRVLGVDAVATDTGLVAAQTESTADGSCSAILDSDGDEVASTCDYSLGEFSADGRYVVGMAAYQSGNGTPDVAILDTATLEPIAEWEVTGQAAIDTDIVFEGPHLLVKVYDRGQWHLMRLGPDLMTQLGPEVGGEMGAPAPWSFAAGPLEPVSR